MRFKMIRLLIVLGVVAFVCSGCIRCRDCLPSYAFSSPHAAISQAQVPPLAQKISYKLAKFNAVVVGGPVIAIIKQGYQQSVMAVSEDAALAQIKPQVKNNTLYIYAGKTKMPGKPATIEIVTPSLVNLQLENGANLLLFGNLHVFNTTITDNTSLAMSLHGQLFSNNLKIVKNGEGRLSVEWVESNDVTVHNYKGSVNLAGRAENLRAWLYGSANLDAKYLRSVKVFVRAQDYARADVLALQHLRARTFNQSNVFYYKTPASLDVQSKDSSNILKLAAWQ